MEKKLSSLKIVWFFLKQYKISFLFLIALAIFVGILETLNVALMYPILSYGLETGVDNNQFLNIIEIFVKFIPINDMLIKYCVLFILLAFLVFIVKSVYFFFSTKLTSKIVVQTKKNVYNKCIHSDYQFFIDNKLGELLYKTSTASTRISNLLNIISDSFVEIILSISIFTLLLSISLKGTILIIAGGIVYYKLTKYLSLKISYVAGKNKLNSAKKESVIVNESISGIKQIKAFGTFDYWTMLFRNAIDTFWNSYRKSYFWGQIPTTLLYLLLYASTGITIIFIRLQYPSNFISIIPTVGTFAFAVFMILPKFSRLGGFRMSYMDVLPDVETVYELLQDNTYDKIKNGTKEFTDLSRGIELRNVNFTHKGRDVILNNISYTIDKGKTTALVGPSGSGKSTIAHLLLRLHDVDSGGIYMDDKNIKDYNINSFLKKVGFVSQDTFIYNASITDNIAFGRDYTDQEIIHAAKLANADEFIKQLPQKYETIVGDYGMRLSGGEKQRIAIARAMMRKPEILILDEATSSLDTIAESVVQKAIDKVSKNCTTFMIAHRLSTIQNADIIHVLDQGKIVESGIHNQLMSKKGKYWELYNIQNTRDDGLKTLF